MTSTSAQRLACLAVMITLTGCFQSTSRTGDGRDAPSASGKDDDSTLAGPTHSLASDGDTPDADPGLDVAVEDPSAIDGAAGTPAGRPPTEPGGWTDVWAGAVSASAQRCEPAALYGSGADPLPMVLILDRDRSGALVRGSLLFGSGDPPPSPGDDDTVFRPLALCQGAVFEGFEYPLEDIVERDTGMSFSFLPWAPFAVWCAAQTPLPVEHGYACTEDVAAPIDLRAPAPLARQLCRRASGPCRCDATKCAFEHQPRRLDLALQGARLEGVLEDRYLGVSTGAVRVVLEHVETR